MSSRSSRTTVLGASVAALAVLAAGVGSATAGSERRTEQFRATLTAIDHDRNADGGSNASGRAFLSRKDRRVKVTLNAAGLSPRLPHAIHIHGSERAGEISKCPGAGHRNDIVDDGLLETAEGLEDYGPVLVSFTTRGDTSPKSTLALDRFPVARDNGRVTYRRTLTVPRGVASRLDDLHVVVHGHDIDGNGQYNGRTTVLGAPIEGELPVACGRIVQR